jgi:hypothetical protein
VKQLHELLGAVDLTLDARTIERLDEASAGDSVDRPKAPPPRRST